MTGATVRQLSDQQLLVLFAEHTATELPVGTFLGVTWPRQVPVWRGKRFAGYQVWNRLGPWELIEGRVYQRDGTVVIDYGWGLTDRLRPITDTLWLGQVWLGTYRSIWFTLEQEEVL